MWALFLVALYTNGRFFSQTFLPHTRLHIANAIYCIEAYEYNYGNMIDR